MKAFSPLARTTQQVKGSCGNQISVDNVYLTEGERALRWVILIAVGLSYGLMPMEFTPALPPPDEVPEEILRAEEDLAARSPYNNRPLSPSEYEQLQALQRNRQRDPEVAPEVEQLIFLLKLRQGLRAIFPF